MSPEDTALVLSLVRAHVLTDPEYISVVDAHYRVRYSVSNGRLHYSKVMVPAHTRRKAMAKRLIDSLACVCKMQDLADPRPEDPPVGRKRRR